MGEAVERGTHRRGIADVERRRVRVRADARSHAPRRLLVGVEHGDVGAELRGPDRHRFADARSAADDRGALAGEIKQLAEAHIPESVRRGR